MPLKVGKLRVGKIDGKHEYLTPIHERERAIFDAFLLPESVEPDRMHNGDAFFIAGFRGTGKTSLLRWHAEQVKRRSAATDFVLFKTDLTESQRMHISNEVGISWSDVDAKSMEVSQDFKDAWRWFILHKIGENLKDRPEIHNDYDSVVPKISRLLGLEDDNIFKKAIGFMPKLEGAYVKIRADLKFFEAELGGDFKRDGESAQTTLSALSARVLKRLKGLEFAKPLYVYFDELEAFYHSPEQHRRDLRMVRDLLFTISSLNDIFRSNGTDIHILAAVRSEVVAAMGSLGQEVDRIVHDRGFLISWHHANRSIQHPLMQMVARKIIASEAYAGVEESADPIGTYFPARVNGEPIDEFMLDKSFYKPRDIVWRLTIAQQLFPSNDQFDDHALRQTEVDYSAKLWDEVRYELGATYSDEEVDAIEGVISGGAGSFFLSEISEKFENAARQSRTVASVLERRSVIELLHDLYRLGAIGNSFRVGTSGTAMRNRWAFRGEPRLLIDKRMMIHPALMKRLSVVASRRRSARGGGRGRTTAHKVNNQIEN